MSPIRIFDLVRVVELPCLVYKPTGEEYLFRIEVWREDNTRYFPRLWLRELLRVQPTLPQDESGIPLSAMADKWMLVEEEIGQADLALDITGIEGQDADLIVQQTVTRILQLLDIQE